MKRTLLPVLITVLCATNASAEDDSHTDASALPQAVHELFLTESVFPNERGEYQPSVGADYQRHSHDAWSTLLNVGLEYGITDRFQVAVSMPWVSIHGDDDSGNGAGDLSAELFYNLIPPTAAFALSLAAELTLPTGNEDRGFGEGEQQFELTMIMAGRAAAVQWQINLGGEWAEDESELFYSLAVLPMQPHWVLVPTLELSGARTDDDRELYVTPGLHWRPADNAGLGLGVPIGVIDDTERLRLMMYYTLEF
jgi:hypothetical protein